MLYSLCGIFRLDHTSIMRINDAVRLMAGLFILLSLLLAHFVNPNWAWFTAFIGLNLLQSAFTKRCPAMWIFKKLGLPE